LRELKVFQRTPIWCFPKLDVPLPKPVRWATRIPGGKTVLRLISQTYVEMLFPVLAHYFTLLPIGKRADKIALSYMNRQVHDPELRDKLTPRYAVGCKRPAFHNTYLSTFNRDNVELVNDRIERVTPGGVVAGGEVRDLDVLILATGFKSQGVHWASYPVLGTNGQSFAEFFRTNRQQAYEGISVPGFPNFFMTLGPYGYVGSSYFALIEAQSHHIVRCLKHARHARLQRPPRQLQRNELRKHGLRHQLLPELRLCRLLPLALPRAPRPCPRRQPLTRDAAAAGAATTGATAVAVHLPGPAAAPAPRLARRSRCSRLV
jgi:cyclohexanone monooxygenase